ncbi:MAG TPA: hypothetical protein VM513_05675 [Kofleriaceae bacterium]|nr:hypothetical protein [Kofleriaceae bacterium]
MNTYRAAVTFACLVAAAAPAAADALDHVEDALAAADERGGRCKRAVFDQLLEIRDMLRDGRDARAARRIQQVRRDANRCPSSVERALARAEGSLQRQRDRVRDRISDRRDDPPPPPPRAKDLPWADYTEVCLAHWVSVEASRGRMNDAKHIEYTNMTGTVCTNPAAQTSYYPNGQLAMTSDGTWYFPNGQLARTGNNTFYYPNGQLLRTADYTWYYPNGQLAYTQSSGWYYPNGQLAGAFESVANWARGHASKQQVGIYDYAMQSDVDAYRMYAVIRLASQAR